MDLPFPPLDLTGVPDNSRFQKLNNLPPFTDDMYGEFQEYCTKLNYTNIQVYSKFVACEILMNAVYQLECEIQASFKELGIELP